MDRMRFRRAPLDVASVTGSPSQLHLITVPVTVGRSEFPALVESGSQICAAARKSTWPVPLTQSG